MRVDNDETMKCEITGFIYWSVLDMDQNHLFITNITIDWNVTNIQMNIDITYLSDKLCMTVFGLISCSE